ncbi:phage tail tip lysozyme [Enterococcus sp. HY326]|uniref:phage tail tip lysozyme n=1 Tax=Enterococcus sp. HY326 TaxID=2971265 RepID=UPI00223F6B05|nr:phage tail tip lysozyme [Enterococcus sp. HY326]
MVNFTTNQLSTAKVIWGILKQFGYNDNSAAGLIGNLYAESSLNPNVNENGGGGYGLGQWTPKSNLYSQASLLGISNAEAETVAGQAKIIAQGDKTGQWSTVGNTAYHSTVVSRQSLDQFKQSGSTTAAAANFCAHWERPRVDLAHVALRIEAADSIYQLLKGSSGETSKGETTMQCIYWRPNGKGSSDGYYFDGTSAKYIAHGDEIVILKRIYKDNNGKDMPEYVFNGNLPWYTRLEQISGQKPVAGILG